MRKTTFDKKRLQEVTEQQARKLYRWGFDWPSNHQVGDVYFPTVIKKGSPAVHPRIPCQNPRNFEG